MNKSAEDWAIDAHADYVQALTQCFTDYPLAKQAASAVYSPVVNWEELSQWEQDAWLNVGKHIYNYYSKTSSSAIEPSQIDLDDLKEIVAKLKTAQFCGPSTEDDGMVFLDQDKTFRRLEAIANMPRHIGTPQTKLSNMSMEQLIKYRDEAVDQERKNRHRLIDKKADAHLILNLAINTVEKLDEEILKRFKNLT